jgi:DinB family protein
MIMMRRRWVVVTMGAVLGITAMGAQAQDASPADKEKALAYLESTKKGVLETTKGLSEAQWNFKAAPDRWSVAECIEHIAAAEDYLRGMVVDNVMKAPAAPDRDTAKIDAGILAMIPDRSQKAQAPEPLKPTSRFGSADGSLKHFVESRTTTEDFLKKTPDLRGHAVDSPLGGAKVDAYEWVLFIAAHSERHTKQIEEVKANENFPKK